MSKASEKMHVNFRAQRAEVEKFYGVCVQQNRVGAEVLRQLMHEFTTGNVTFTMKKRGATP